MPRGGADLQIHRLKTVPKAVLLNGVPTVPASAAIVQSWPLLCGPDRRAPAITAFRDGLVTAAELSAELSAASRVKGRAELAELVRLLAAGCESELEIWGYLGVFDIPGLDHGVRRKWIHARGSWHRLDLVYLAEKVVVELDGAHFHTKKRRWERDRRRDSALASVGMLTLRFTHDRLHYDVGGCREETLATLATRR
jgi:hypothetical protein